MTHEQIRQEAEMEYPVIFERDFNPLSDGSLDINESAREAYIKGRMKSLEEKEKEIAELVGIISNCYHIVIAYANRHGEHLIHPDHANLLLSIQNIIQKYNP